MYTFFLFSRCYTEVRKEVGKEETHGTFDGIENYAFLFIQQE